MGSNQSNKAFFRQLSGSNYHSCQAFVWQSSGSCTAVEQSLGSHHRVIRQSIGNCNQNDIVGCQAFVWQSSGNCQAVVMQSLSSCQVCQFFFQAVNRQLTGNHEVVFLLSSIGHLADVRLSLSSLQTVFRQKSGSCQTVFMQLSGSDHVVGRQVRQTVCSMKNLSCNSHLLTKTIFLYVFYIGHDQTPTRCTAALIIAWHLLLPL